MTEATMTCCHRAAISRSFSREGRVKQEKREYIQTKGEELANTLTHGIGAAAALVASVPLVMKAIRAGSPLAVFSMVAYGLSLVLLYTMSATYHGVRTPALKKKLRVCDHCSIFVLILGTYIPLSLLAIGGAAGIALCIANTVLATVGIILNLIDLERFAKPSVLLYALMGWLVILAIRPLVSTLSVSGLALLVGGGVAYTAGILFYKTERKYMHVIWHFFVLAGSILHFACVATCCL